MAERPMEKLSLGELAARSQRKDLDAFSAIVRRLHGEVRGFVALMAVAPDWVDDVVQDVFIEVFQSLHNYDPARSFARWVRGVARNVVRRHQEDQSRESRLRSGAVSELLRSRNLAAEQADRPNLMIEALAGCLERLPEHLRRLLHLRYSEDRSSEEIAALTARKPEAVRASLMRSRQQLLECVRLAAERAGVRT